MNKFEACINHIYDSQARDFKNGLSIEFVFIKYIFDLDDNLWL